MPPLYEMLCMQKFCQGVGANLGVLTEGGTSEAASGEVREDYVVSHNTYM